MNPNNLDELQRLPQEVVAEDSAECISSDVNEKATTFRLTGICL